MTPPRRGAKRKWGGKMNTYNSKMITVINSFDTFNRMFFSIFDLTAWPKLIEQSGFSNNIS